MATFCFLAKDAPFYHLGYSMCMGVLCVGVLAAVLYAGLVILENNGAWQGGEKESAKSLSL